MNLKIKILPALWSLLTVLLLCFLILYMMKPENRHILEKNETDNTLTENLAITDLRLISEIQKNYSENKAILNEYVGIGESKIPLLIYRYSKNVCPSCIMKDLSDLSDIQSIIGKDKVLVLPAFGNTRNDRVILANELSAFNYKNIPNELLVIPYDSVFMIRPYFAIINQKGNIEMIFFPRRNNRKLTDVYFSEIKKIIGIQ